MKVRALLPLLTYPDASTPTGVSCGIAAAKLIGADLHALALEADIPDVSNAFSRVLMNLPELVRNAETQSASEGGRLLAAARSAGEQAGVTVTTGIEMTQLALLGEEAARHARYFDVSFVLLGAENPGARALAETVVFGSGRPTIVLPDQSPPTSFDRVAIAWDGSRVAARAVSDARIFLERASEISVLTVTDEKPIEDPGTGARLVEYFVEAGLNATYAPIQAEDCPIAETLQQHAISLGATFLVMGGYGHSRLRDFVLGGATEGVLTDLRITTLLSH